ncbi:MAG: amino acid ABC transporter ATP-binding protein, partial [Granulosicoccaceae bacterium]
MQVALRKQLAHFTLAVDFECKPGITALFGRSGCGKTSLINQIAGLMQPDSGRVVAAGRTLFDSDAGVDVPAHKRRIGYVFQEARLFPHLTVLENCTLAPVWVRKMPKHEAEAIAMQYLERVKIPDQANKYPGQLSGGQQQRVAIARSLCMNPQVMLFDEPTS